MESKHKGINFHYFKNNNKMIGEINWKEKKRLVLGPTLVAMVKHQFKNLYLIYLKLIVFNRALN